jgi:hypothetical protein
VTFEKIKNAVVYKDYDDNSHPNGGNLVLMNDGKAWFGGKKYVRDGYPLPEEEPLAQWEQELLATQNKPAEPRFKVGDKIIVKKDQWNIEYNLVDGPVVGEITSINPASPVFGLSGANYLVRHETVKDGTLSIWTDRAAEPFLKPAPTSRFKAGDRVVLRGRTHAFDGQIGTVHEDTFIDERRNYDVAVTPDSVTDGFPVWFHDSEVDFEPTPPPVTHRYPEGLYKRTTDTSIRVYIQHEERTDLYAITYLTGGRDEQGIPAVSQGMSANVVAAYTLVTAA